MTTQIILPERLARLSQYSISIWRLTFFVLLFLSITSASGSAQAPLAPLPCPGSTFTDLGDCFPDLDTNKIDTTGLGLDYESAWPYDSILYVRKNFEVYFPDSVLLVHQFPDSVVEFTWSDISTKFDTIRNGIRHLDSIWGPVLLIKRPTRTSTTNQIFGLHLSEWVKAVDIIHFLDSIGWVGANGFLSYSQKPTHVPSDPGFDNRNQFPDLVHSGSTRSELGYPRHDSRGGAWHLFAIKAPIAWDLSTGSRDIVVAALDWISDSEPGITVQTGHPEMPLDDGSDGTYVKIDASNTYDGTIGTPEFGVGHGMLIAEAVGEIDNGSGSGGVCPECRGYVVDNQSLGTPLLIDVDAISGNGRTLADVVNMSFAGGVSRASLLELYRKNIVAVAASGNNMMNHGNCSQASYASGTEAVTEGGIEFKQIQPRTPDPSATAAEIPSAPGQFINPIAVGATML